MRMQRLLTGCLLLLGAGAAMAQSPRAVVRTTGQFNADGSASYSVYVASGPEDLEEITIAASMPAGVRYLESVHTPQDGTYDGVKADTIYWRVTKLDRDTLIGPFVFRVRPDGTTASLPATVQAAVAYQRPVAELVESPGTEGQLRPLAASGSIAVDQRGTLNAQGANAPVEVGETGVMLFVPEGAVSQRVTLTIRRVPFNDSQLPKTDPPTWWCAVYQLSAEPQVGFAKDVSMSLPARRALTPGVELKFFAVDSLETAGKAAAERGLPQQTGGAQVVCSVQPLNSMVCRLVFGGVLGQLGGLGAFGYVEQDNLKSKVNGSQLGSVATSAVNALISPPSIIAILIGAR